MAIDIGNVVRITDKQTFDAQQVLNVYYYNIDSTPGSTPDEIAQAWWEKMNASIRAVQTSGVVHNEVLIENLDGTLDFGRYVPATGSNAGTCIETQPLSAFAAYGITLTVSTRLVRPGSKRIVGIPEAYNGDYGVLTGAAVGLLNTLGEDMTEDVSFGLLGAGMMHPVIVGFPHPESPTGRPARLERVDFEVTGYLVNPYVTTQNTRKRGRGA